MTHEPSDAPVPDQSKTKYFIGLAVAIVFGGLLAVFVLPNLFILTDEGPAADTEFQITVPESDGTGLTGGD